jgi:hypothetical protein
MTSTVHSTVANQNQNPTRELLDSVTAAITSVALKTRGQPRTENHRHHAQSSVTWPSMASMNGSAPTTNEEPTNNLIQWLRENDAIITKVFPKDVPGLFELFTSADRKGLEEGYLRRMISRREKSLFVSRVTVF